MISKTDFINLAKKYSLYIDYNPYNLKSMYIIQTYLYSKNRALMDLIREENKLCGIVYNGDGIRIYNIKLLEKYLVKEIIVRKNKIINSKKIELLHDFE